MVSAIKCGKSNVDIIRFLLEKGADPNLPSEFSAIHWAVKLGEEGVIRVIRELGFPIVAKEAVEEKFVSLQLAQVVQEDNARRQQVLQTKKDIEQSKHEDLKRANKRTNGVTVANIIIHWYSLVLIHFTEILQYYYPYSTWRNKLLFIE